MWLNILFGLVLVVGDLYGGTLVCTEAIQISITDCLTFGILQTFATWSCASSSYTFPDPQDKSSIEMKGSIHLQKGGKGASKISRVLSAFIELLQKSLASVLEQVFLSILLHCFA